jgi:hypothetical protein
MARQVDNTYLPKVTGLEQETPPVTETINPDAKAVIWALVLVILVLVGVALMFGG